MDPIILFFSAAILTTSTFVQNIITTKTAAKNTELANKIIPIQHDVNQMLVYASTGPTMVVHEGESVIPDRPKKRIVSTATLACNDETETAKKNVNGKVWIMQNKTAINFKPSEEEILRPVDEMALNKK